MLRPMDTVARFGGDEFTFLFEDLTSEREVVLIADRICQAASRPIEHRRRRADASRSASGSRWWPTRRSPPETVIREADAAMYRAKERGRSRFELFDEESRRRAIARIELEAALRAGGRARPAPRPLPAARSSLNEFTGRALGRGAGPLGASRAAACSAPTEFMPVAEDTGLVDPDRRFALEHALRQLARWRASKPDMRLSLNLSPRQLARPEPRRRR